MARNPLRRIRRNAPTPVRPVAGAHAGSRTPRYGVETKRRARRPRREGDRQPGPLSRAVNSWWNRLISAVFGGKLSEQTEQYLAHQTKRDYVCNTIGQAAWGMLFPLLTMVATWLVGAEQAGLFSMAFTVGTLLLFLANYGVRTLSGLRPGRPALLPRLPDQPVHHLRRDARGGLALVPDSRLRRAHVRHLHGCARVSRRGRPG